MHGCEFHEKPRRKCWVAAETSQNPQNSTKTATLFRRPHHLLMYLHIQLHIISFSVSGEWKASGSVQMEKSMSGRGFVSSLRFGQPLYIS